MSASNRWDRGLTRAKGLISSLSAVFLGACVAWLVGTGSAVSRAEEYSYEQCLVCRRDHAHAALGIDLEGDGPRYAPERQVDVLHIKLDVTPDFARHTVSGTVSLTVRPIAKPVSQLTLDAMDITVDKVTGDVEVADFTSTRETLTVLFAQPVQPDQQVTLNITYRAEPRRGLYFRTPDMGYPATDTHVWTQGEAHEARFWFPCFDYPNERSTTEIVCHVPRGMTVLSNGRKVSETTSDETGLTTVHWLQEQPHVNYLICLVAGYLDKLEAQHGSVPLGFYSQPSISKYARNAFRDTPAIMAFFEEEIGMAYPWNKYDQVTILDFVAGGMENTTLTTLTHRTVNSDAEENIPSPWGLDAHEMAHQWFGDYVTCKDWSHLWLNEGFATYYALLYDGHKFGRDALLYGLYKDAEGILRQGNDRRPMVFRGYKNASEQFDYRAYPKGSWVLHMLRSQLGEDLYRQGVQTYLRRHALSSVVTDDLRQVFEELSGRPLDRFFDQWVYHARHPDLRITYAWEPETKLARMVVEQTHEVNNDVLLFDIPATFRFIAEDGSRVDHDVRIDRQRQEFFVPLASQPRMVRFDPDYEVLANVEFNVPEPMLLAQMDQQDDVMGRILAVAGLARNKSKQGIERLGKALREDPFFGVRVESAQALSRVGGEEAYAELARSTDQSDARVRLAVINAIGGVYRPETATTLEEVLARETNPHIQIAAVRALAKFEGESSQEAILAALRSDSWRQMVAGGAIDALRARNDAAQLPALIRTLEARAEDFPTEVLRDALRTVGQLGKLQDHREPARRWITSYVRDARPVLRTAAIAALGDLGDPLALPVLESFSSQSYDTRLSSAAREAITRLNERKPLAPTEVIELRSALRQLESDQKQLREQLERLEKKTAAAAAAPAAPADSAKSEAAP